MKKAFTILFFICFINLLQAQDKVTVSGRVTDFAGNPIDSVLVRVKDRNFNNPFQTYSDKNGYFSMKVDKGNYNCIYAAKISDYRKTKLEYWAWNVPIFEDMVINPQYNNMEVYGINVMEPQVTPHETYMIYFRPMSLKKIIKLIESQDVDKKSFEQVGKVEQLLKPVDDNIYDIAPSSITPGELSVKINGVESKIVNIERVKEYARGMNMYGYLVQVIKPEEIKAMNIAYDKISILLNSEETGETGLGEAFVKRHNK